VLMILFCILSWWLFMLGLDYVWDALK